LLFDGESSLNSLKAKKKLKDTYNLTIFVNPKYKQVLAERFIREVKLRVSIALDLENLKLSQWKNVLFNVVTTINAKLKKNSLTNQLKEFFLRSTTHYVPQQKATLYKFKPGDRVITDLSREQRKQLNYKYSLFYGMIYKMFKFKKQKSLKTIFFFLGKTDTNVIFTVVSRNLVVPRNTKLLIPYYTLKNKVTKQNNFQIFIFFAPLSYEHFCQQDD